jgi:hypothetical protein
MSCTRSQNSGERRSYIDRGDIVVIRLGKGSCGLVAESTSDQVPTKYAAKQVGRLSYKITVAFLKPKG